MTDPFEEFARRDLEEKGADPDTAADVVAETYRDPVPVCAWCPPEKQAEVPDGYRVSHTACPECTERLLAEADAFTPEDDR